MNANRLLAHYERIADAPDAIARLRRFILDLAVRGKLVPQDPNDDPASELLERIAAEKAKISRRPKDLPEIDTTQELGEPPPNWCVVPLIALGSWAIGSGFPKNEQGMSVGPYFFLKVSDMNLPGNEKFITTANNCINDDAATRMRVKIHPPGTIIFPKIGGAIATNKRRLLTKSAAIDNNCLGITFSSHLDVEWAFLLLTTVDFTKYQAGTAVPALQQGTLERIPVGLPPLAEQHRIVAKVDELMGLCDRLETARTEREATRDRMTAASLVRLNDPDPDPGVFRNQAAFAIENLTPLTTRRDQIKALRQTILNLAVRGKLVAQDPNDEPASELLDKIEAKRKTLYAAKLIPKPKTLPLLEDMANLFLLPEGWMWSMLGELCYQVADGPHFSPQYVPAGEGVPFLSTRNVRSDGFDLTSVKYVSRKDHEEFCKRIRPEKHDIIYTKGGTTGIAKLNDLDMEFSVWVHLAVLRIDKEWLFPRYLEMALNSPHCYEQSQQYTQGISNFDLGLTRMIKITAPLPPLAEQHRIVARVDELMALCDRLETSFTTGDDTRRRLLDALLHEVLVMGADRKSVA